MKAVLRREYAHSMSRMRARRVGQQMLAPPVKIGPTLPLYATNSASSANPANSALLHPHLRMARRHRAQSLRQQLFHFLHGLDQPAAHHRQIGEIARTRSSIFGATSAGKISSACTGEFFS